ncbi:MAG: aldo/keto reductase [Ruthenibacterium sp.]
MEYRVLGKTGLRVSAVGFGGIPIQRLDAPRTRVLMEALAAHGVNYIDTARGYTVSEEFLGQALQGGLREKFILASKSMARTYQAMAADIETSLRNLRTDYIEVYQMHNLKPEEFELAFRRTRGCGHSGCHPGGQGGAHGGHSAFRGSF